MKSIVIKHEDIKVCEERIVVDVEDKSLDITLLLDEHELAPLFCGAAWAGTLVWEAAVALSNYVLNEVDLKPLRVLELGAGLGVPGMVAGLLGAKRVVITEQPELVPLIRTNIRRNIASLSSVEAKILSWGREATTSFCDEMGLFDLVLSCDCVYEPLYGESWRDLAQTMDVLCQHNPNCKILASVERRHADGINKFLSYIATDTTLKARQLIRIPKTERGLCDEGEVIEVYCITHNSM
ncbi:hypothetical protein THRCLA_00335 [Thraustotheca clavata]|uniref:Uncharacterized protein n=1 Tax=Thraustotheca clavata TaxID=74557 RepID=A0A1W0ABM3_9STRA|nr:hypothetical protein THRCLA_00335 [Thraustotheca clavata]